MARVEENLNRWHRYHYGYEEDGRQVREPETAQTYANTIAGILRRAIAAKELDSDRRLWAKDVALGAETLAEAELDAEIESGGDAIDRLAYIGWRRDHNESGARFELTQQHFRWFMAGAVVGGVVVYLVNLL